MRPGRGVRVGPLAVELGPRLRLLVLHLAVEVLRSLLGQLLEVLGRGQVFGYRGARRKEMVGWRMELSWRRSRLSWRQRWRGR